MLSSVETAIQNSYLGQYTISEKHLVHRDVKLPISVYHESISLEQAVRCDSKEAEVVISLYFTDKDCIIAVNTNHALCDGREMRTLLSSVHTAPTPTRVVGTESWGTLADVALAGIHTTPYYIPVQDCISIHDALGSAETVSEDVTVALPVQSLLEYKIRGSSPTGTIAAALQLALGRRYLSIHTEAASCAVSVSILVDIRPYVTCNSEIGQAFGTVTVDCIIGRDTTSLTQLAAEASGQIKHRIERGEALRQASALAGNMASCCPSATIELSNHGRYPCSVRMSQYFPGYDGISVAMYSEGDTMRLTASVGKVDRGCVRSLLEEVGRLLGMQ
ncbi:hypothetical protein J8273_2789 [Carpediemonas membranifera]|uniref:Uncharacterized protein n=1 Tax=Carpediemonas membranifera TaxID=201153 RepID=A0A8J6B8V4_9EUKA|nr:hypothetical protein J8273_2789 [Carpediemonas membranifera]|eukprot:KAG9395594.1 hypothetical protein J8273_2789 [Carpediemonas membranifera]